MILRRLGVLFLGGALVAGCHAAAPVRVAPGATTAATTSAAPPNPDHLTWVQRSAEYEIAVRQTYRLATRYVEEQAQARRPRSWAVILDADETLISNLQYQVERARAGLGYTTVSWHAWVLRREATAMPGAAAFLARVRGLGGQTAIVTNRLQSECDDTAAVLRAQALAYDVMLCRPDGTPSDKNPRFQAVATGQSPLGSWPLDVVAYIGDNVLDFPMLTQALRGQGEAAFADFGARYFILPNPMYGSWWQ